MGLCRVQGVLALGLTLIGGLTTGMAAEQHVVPPSELHRQIAAASEARQKSLAQLESFFSSKEVKGALRTAKVDPRRLQQGFAALSDEELQRLAARAHRAQADLAAGALSNQELTYIVIALATAVIVLILV